MFSPSTFTRVNRSNPKFAKPVVVWRSPVAARFISSAQRHDIRANFWHRHCCIMRTPPLRRQQQRAKESNWHAKNNNSRAVLTFPASYAHEVCRQSNLLLLVVTLHTASLTITNSTFCPHGVFMCFVWISEHTAIISLYCDNWLVSITETVCLLRGTSCIYIYIHVYIYFRFIFYFKDQFQCSSSSPPCLLQLPAAMPSVQPLLYNTKTGSYHYNLCTEWLITSGLENVGILFAWL
jgi:hypothetical protein